MFFFKSTCVCSFKKHQKLFVMKTKLLFLTFVFSLFLTGQKNPYSEWIKETRTNIRLIPEYGDTHLSPQIRENDRKAISRYFPNTSMDKASEQLINTGFSYITKGDLKTAMYRFNQAWLLTPENENVFWGFGTVYFIFLDYDKALLYYNKGLTLNPEHPNLLTDKATVYLSKFYKERNKDHLNRAKDLLLQSYTLDTTNVNTLFKLSGSYFFDLDCENAVKYFTQCEDLGGQPITNEYRETLTKKCIQEYN